MSCSLCDLPRFDVQLTKLQGSGVVVTHDLDTSLLIDGMRLLKIAIDINTNLADVISKHTLVDR